jgi:membrane-bound inhibitor of C-type lysozyme
MRLPGMGLAVSLLAMLPIAIATGAGQAQAEKVTYRCENGKSFIAEYSSKDLRITFLPDGSKLTLPNKVILAYGDRYSDGKTTLISQGANAIISKDRISYKCVEVPEPVQGLW